MPAIRRLLILQRLTVVDFGSLVALITIEMSAPAAVHHPFVALRSRLAVKMMPTVLMTFAVAQWVSTVLGAARLETMAITFAWTVATGHQFISSRHADPVQKFCWSRDAILSALGGQILWVVLPCVQLADPNAWFCATMTTPPMIAALSGVVAVAWSLRPLVMGLLGRQASLHHSGLDAPVLYCSFFLLSGNLVFATGASASVLAFLVSRVDWRTMRSSLVVQQPILVCPIES